MWVYGLKSGWEWAGCQVMDTMEETEGPEESLETPWANAEKEIEAGETQSLEEFLRDQEALIGGS